jgi:hypothetical protein
MEAFSFWAQKKGSSSISRIIKNFAIYKGHNFIKGKFLQKASPESKVGLYIVIKLDGERIH